MDFNDNYNDIDTLDRDSGYRTREEYEKRAEYVDENLWVKLERVGKKISFAKDIMALYRYMVDSDISWYRKTIVVFALVYFISPVDAIPDIAPLVGYMDDLGVITALLKYLGSELIPYYDR
jgi:uncharacterized membrane protein YkvA (DUF1232 family)